VTTTTTTLRTIKVVNCGPRLVADLNLVQHLRVLEYSSIHCVLPERHLEYENPNPDLGFTASLPNPNRDCVWNVKP